MQDEHFRGNKKAGSSVGLIGLSLRDVAGELQIVREKSLFAQTPAQVPAQAPKLRRMSQPTKKRLKKFVFFLLSALFTLLTTKTANCKPTLPFSLPPSFQLSFPTFPTFQQFIEKRQANAMKSYRWVGRIFRSINPFNILSQLSRPASTSKIFSPLLLCIRYFHVYLEAVMLS